MLSKTKGKPEDPDQRSKLVFLIMFPSASLLNGRITTICEYYPATLFNGDYQHYYQTFLTQIPKTCLSPHKEKNASRGPSHDFR